MKPTTLHAEPAQDTARAAARRPQGLAQDKAAAGLHALQRGAGNRAMQRMLAATVAQRACDCGTCEKCQAKHEHGHGPGEETLASGFLSGKGGGQPLGDSVRGFMEERFGQDFGGVRVHTDGHAARSAREISAVAYTAGSDIFFAPGQYRPDSHEGRHLLAHELTHVVQQGGSPVSAQAQLTVGAADDAYEREADQVADAVMGHGDARAITPLASPASLQRKKCVTGAFINNAAHLELAEGEKPPFIKDAAWDPATGWFEDKPLTLDAKFEPAEGRDQSAHGEFHLFAWGGGSRVAPAKPGTEASEDPARLRIQAGPEEPRLGDHWKSFGRFLPDIGGHTASATIAPGIRAEAGGEKLEGVIEFRGQLIDRCAEGNAFDPNKLYPKTLAQVGWFEKFDFKVPDDWTRESKRSHAAAEGGKQQSVDKKDEAPGKTADTQPATETKGGKACARGWFTSIPSGTLRAVWDPQLQFLGREFQMMAGFAPRGDATDCRHGEYRQFVQAFWERNLLEEGPSKGQPQEVTKKQCEDKLEYEKVDSKQATGRYGHRSDKNPDANSIYGPDDPAGGCRYRGWDRPGMYVPLGQKVRFKHVFTGQLIDTCRLPEEPPGDAPYKGDGVLAASTWIVEGEHTRARILTPNERALEMSRQRASEGKGVAKEKKDDAKS